MSEEVTYVFVYNDYEGIEGVLGIYSSVDKANEAMRIYVERENAVNTRPFPTDDQRDLEFQRGDIFKRRTEEKSSIDDYHNGHHEGITGFSLPVDAPCRYPVDHIEQMIQDRFRELQSVKE